MQKTDKFIINGMAGSVDRIRDTRAYNLLLKCLRGRSQVSLSAHGTHSAYSRTPAGTTAAVNTHTVNTHPEQWAAIYAAAPGEQLGVWCPAQGHQSCGIEGGESAVTFTPPT